jgi:membrane-associated phospholipid phosphatase
LHGAVIDCTFAAIKFICLLQEKSKNHFGLAFFFTVAIAVVISLFILLTGKKESFQLINGNDNGFFDFFFKYFTHAGDGWMWAPLLLFCVFFRRKYLLAVIAGVVISTVLSQFLKRVIFADELRPITYLSENFPVHVIEGVKINRLHSFPSGHTSAAFTIALLLAYMINKKAWSLTLPVLALLVGYSRVYLAQHFLTDVLAGICVGVVSAVLSLMIYRNLLKRKTKIESK